MIYLVDARALAIGLADGTVTAREKMTYLICGWIFFTLSSYSTLTFSNASRTWPGLIEGVSVILISIWGIRRAYQANGGDCGSEFVTRFTCLLFPVSVKVYLIVWSLYYLLAWPVRTVFPKLTFESEPTAELVGWFAQYHLPWVVTIVAVCVAQALILTIIAKHLSCIVRKTAVVFDRAQNGAC